MKNNYQYQPVKYFGWTIALTWLVLIFAALCSYSQEFIAYKNIFILIGLFIPFIVAMTIIFRSDQKWLKQDFINRSINLKLIKPKYWLILISIMPSVLILATTISLGFGLSTDQFNIAPELTNIGSEFFIILVILVLAPTFEELGWRGYGVDSLNNNKRSLIKSTLIFAVLWNLWHLPLFFIKDYYQYELLHTNIFYALNFIVSLFPAAFLMNWIYFKNNRSIISIVIFHIMLNLFSVLLQTEQGTKIIITILLSIISVVIYHKDKKFFLAKHAR